MMKRILLTVLWTIASAALVALEARAETRVALVIGNSAYSNISRLANPKNDAVLMARTLQQVGFEVVLATDADRTTLGRAIRKFGKTLRTSGKDAIGLLFYAGHGVQARGSNFIIPIGAQIEDHADLRLEAVSVSDILAQMESAGNRLNLVILDACRNNPFKGRFRGSTRGLARVEAASGSMVAFAAAPGQVALDGAGTNSPYTSALVAAIKQPGLTVEQVFKRVRVEVERKTGGTQTPWEESSLRGEFYFRDQPKSQTVVGRDDTVELTYWNSVKDSGDPTLLKTYMKRYPQGLFAGLAEAMIKQLETTGANDAQQREQRAEATRRAADVAYWEAVSGSSDPELVRSYLERFPDGIFSRLAQARLKQLKAEEQAPRDDPFNQQQMAMADTDAADDTDAAAASPPRAKRSPSIGTALAKKTAPVETTDTESSETLVQTAKASPPTQTEAETDPDLPRKLQRALDKAGCNPGAIDGQWGRNSKSALDRFARYAKLTLPDEPVSAETLDLLESRDGRVCPLKCSARQVERNGQCVAKTCPRQHVLTAGGNCEPKLQQVRKKRQADPEARKRRRPPKWGTDYRSVPSQY